MQKEQKYKIKGPGVQAVDKAGYEARKPKLDHENARGVLGFKKTSRTGLIQVNRTGLVQGIYRGRDRFFFHFYSSFSLFPSLLRENLSPL